MRYILIFWGIPMSLFWGWYTLSAFDINFGFLMLTRAFHEVLFELYGEMLGIDPTLIPMMVAKACILDTFLIFGLFAFRRRAQIRAWWRARYPSSEPSAPSA